MAHQRIVKDEELLKLKHMIFDNMIDIVEKELGQCTQGDNILDGLWQVLGESFPKDIVTEDKQ